MLLLIAAEARAAEVQAQTDGAWVARCPGRPTLRGIDVSKWQGEIDWAAVRAGGVRFAYVRASDGATAPDPLFARNWEGARRAGITRGAYQYFRPAEDPDEQADLLLEAMGAPRKGDLPPALDVEVDGGMPAEEVVGRIDRWVRRVRRATGVDPVVYTSALNWSELTENSGRFRRLGLWVAHHGVPCPNTPEPWRRWMFHQSSAEAEVAGVPVAVDENVFWGGVRALRRVVVKEEAAARAAWRRWRRGREKVAPPSVSASVSAPAPAAPPGDQRGR